MMIEQLNESAYSNTAADEAIHLVEDQRLPTSGARGVSTFVVSGQRYLIVPQLARDLPDTQAHMNGGDSDVGAPIFRWEGGKFVDDGVLPLSGGEDVLFFKLGADEFLITAGIRTGHGPFNYNVEQVLYKRSGAEWQSFQTFSAFAAKQWHFFQIGSRAFLALAQGVTLGHIEAKNPRESRIYEWDGSRFVEFQTLDGKWGYNWEFFNIGGESFLCYADHVGDSMVLKWDGTSFAPFQSFSPSGGRCFRFFEVGGEYFLAFANIQGESLLYRWDGKEFTVHQKLSGPGGREFCVFRAGEKVFLVQINFITGEPSAPRTALKSRLYRWSDGRMKLIEEFSTFGGTEASAFEENDAIFLAVSNSLTPEVRFRQDSLIYRFNA
jgi:EPTP domain